MRATQAEGKKSSRNGNQSNDECSEWDGNERRNLEERRRYDETVATEADKGLLSHRDEPGIAGEQIPGLGKRQVVADFDQEAHFGAAGPGRHRQQHTDRDEHDGEPEATGAG